jgi:site-specific DNA-methyltransferase (adenine-specific)
MTVRVEHADMLEAIPRLVGEGVQVDAIVTDPPYHLTATLARFGKIDINADDATSTRLRQKLDGAARLAHGFMNQQWDGGDIAFRPETWATVASIMRPGAFLVAFGGTRTHHRVWCAIEDAGFVIQDTIMWMFATGFPKRRDALKPAHEPIVLAYKPDGKRMMQIDECRIATGDDMGDPHRFAKSKEHPGWSRLSHTAETIAARGDRAFEAAATLGRWPANICHDGSDEVMAAFPDSAGQLFTRPKLPKVNNGIYGNFGKQEEFVPRGDTGSAARFFFSAKAGAQDRYGSRHPTVKPVDLIAWLVALVTPPGGTFLDPFAGSGTAGVAALKTGRNAILIEREAAYITDIRERMAHYSGEGRHSLASKARRAQDKPLGGLFAEPYDETADAIGSYADAVKAIGERVAAGEPIPDFFLSERKP